MSHSHRLLALGAALLAAGLAAHRVQSARAQDQEPQVTVYKSPT